MKKLSNQITQFRRKIPTKKAEFEGNIEKVISTGSTLLDLAIAGGRVKGGGLPGGILVEIFGPSGCGKTVLLCEIAGMIIRQGGQVMFRDPEARLNHQFAKLFGLNPKEIDYKIPDTIPEVFTPVQKWKPEPTDKIHGVFADSLAALSTDMEMESEDKMGMRRAKEFSEALRRTCRTIQARNFLMVCSNQVRQNFDAGPYGQKYKSPGGEAIGFYSSLRLRCSSAQKITTKKQHGKKELSRVIGVETQVEVHKSSVWSPYRTANLIILFDYGIDDIRANLKFIKEHKEEYSIGAQILGNSISKAVKTVEEQGLEKMLKEEVINLWEDIENKFKEERKPKR